MQQQLTTHYFECVQLIQHISHKASRHRLVKRRTSTSQSSRRVDPQVSSTHRHLPPDPRTEVPYLSSPAIPRSQTRPHTSSSPPPPPPSRPKPRSYPSLRSPTSPAHPASDAAAPSADLSRSSRGTLEPVRIGVASANEGDDVGDQLVGSSRAR